MRGVIDLFCGTGGFTYGFETHPSSQFDVLLGFDKKNVATETFKQNHPRAEVVNEDIREWPADETEAETGVTPEDVQIIVGGPPCQGFSSIRPDRGDDVRDHRNGLYTDFIEYVAHYEPDFFIMENVVGLATHDDGETIARILDDAREVGYSTDWRILNGANFGLPQRRERLIMIGAADERNIQFPSPTHQADGRTIGYRDKSKVITTQPTLENFRDSESLPEARTIMDAIGDLPELEAGGEATGYTKPPENQYQESMRRGSGELRLHKATNHGEKMMTIIKNSGPNKQTTIENLEASDTVDNVEDYITSGYSSSYSRLDPNLPSVTMTVNFVHPASNKCIHPYQNRALTPREGARIQSFPDSFEFSGSRSDIVEQIGNAVPPLLGRVLAEHVLGMYDESYETDYEACVIGAAPEQTIQT
ncbi:DNA cytosine methyltransferase [Natronomonas marina]|jgi:DNA (cytosine-5)-methyltransferase 1|uniref:DNA cytosine methyltransferase n=1 Tax=Natronomonas marina TaxID=2961939 RepID=UPI0020C939E8|nr:DNA cytosine methyltransferase [Natronomonas marina]